MRTSETRGCLSPMIAFAAWRSRRMARSDYERQPAPEFLFQRRPLRRRHQVDAQVGEAVLVTGDQPPHRAIRHEERVISTVSLGGPTLYEGHDTRGELLVEGPRDGSIVIHASYTAVEVRDMAGTVRIAATHARATILDATGQVDAAAGCVDFAGSCGRITLSAEAEINLKIIAPVFDGTLLAWAQGPVRILVPSKFNTSFEAIVGGCDDFVCRADLRSKVKQSRQGELYVFTYAVGADDAPRARLHLRSEGSTVVIDQLRETQ